MISAFGVAYTAYWHSLFLAMTSVFVPADIQLKELRLELAMKTGDVNYGAQRAHLPSSTSIRPGDAANSLINSCEYRPTEEIAVVTLTVSGKHFSDRQQLCRDNI